MYCEPPVIDLDKTHPQRLLAQPWWMDERKFPVVVDFNEDGSPYGNLIVEYRRYRDMPRWFFKSKWRNKAYRLQWECFYSGAKLYVCPMSMYDKLNASRIPWAMSIEHLVSIRSRRYLSDIKYRIDSIDHNLVLSGMKLNVRIGHDPLPVKLMQRKYLRSLNINREYPTLQDYGACFEGILKSKEPMKYKGGFMWFEDHYTCPLDRKKARLCYQEMMLCEEEYLHVQVEEKMDWINNFEWRW